MRKAALAAPDIVLRPIHANAGVEAAYRKCLQALSRAMAADILNRMKRHYPRASKRMALDDDPVVVLRVVLRRWGRIWTKRFDKMSAEIAEMFAKRSQADLDAAFRKRLREAGFTVRFQPTERMISAYRATAAENVGLIKSIPQQFLKDVESAVWRSAMKGGAMSELSKEIRAKYGVTYRRAAFIASDQSAKARTTFDNARRTELGIRTAKWRHSHAGKKPRPTHVAMDGQKYEIAKGMWDPAVGKFVQPGELPRCRCTSKSIITSHR